MFKFYCITDSNRSKKENIDNFSAFHDFENLDDFALEIRFPDFTNIELFNFIKDLKKEIPDQLKIFINDKIELAEIFNLEGVHLKENSIDTKIYKKYYKDRFKIGRSTHSINSILKAQKEEGDFVTFGPVFNTPSKKKYGKPVGVELFYKNYDKIDISVLALGGINIDKVEYLKNKKFSGIAAIRAFFPLIEWKDIEF